MKKNLITLNAVKLLSNTISTVYLKTLNKKIIIDLYFHGYMHIYI